MSSFLSPNGGTAYPIPGPTVTTVPGDKYVLSFHNTLPYEAPSPDHNAMEKTLGVGSSCEVALLARDGVWRTSAPKMLTTNSISLTGASRADLAVRCANDSTIMHCHILAHGDQGAMGWLNVDGGQGAPTFCGDATCDANESQCTCSDDCGCGNDCSSRVNGRPSRRYCCGDGTQQAAEGDAGICNGNY